MAVRLLVCGSRTWSTEEQYHRVVDEIVALAPALVIHGGAKGADECADMWCQVPPSPIPLLVFRADWHAEGKAAGPIRNARMLAFGALWKQKTRSPGREWMRTGTGDMVRRMLGAGLLVRWIESVDVAAVDLATMPGQPTS